MSAYEGESQSEVAPCGARAAELHQESVGMSWPDVRERALALAEQHDLSVSRELDTTATPITFSPPSVSSLLSVFGYES
jgi:hypothetical protein